MPDYISDKRLYHTADRSRIVEEGDPAAAFLLVGEGAIIPENEVQRLGLGGHLREYRPADPLQAQEAAHQAALQRGAVYEAQSRANTIERMRMAKGTPAEGSAGPNLGPASSSMPVVATPPYTSGNASPAASTDVNAQAPSQAGGETTTPEPPAERRSAPAEKKKG
jgi:hypothetical protein